MDRYLKQREHNFDREFTNLGPAVCVLGKSGIGKSWAVHEALDPCIELTSDVLKSKQDTLGFLEKIRGTTTPVLLDEYETVQDLVGLREIKGPPTLGLFVVVSQIPVKFDFEIASWNFPVPGPEDIRRIVPGVSDEIVQKCRGDLRYAFQSLIIQSDDKDEFQGARDFLESLVSRTSSADPATSMGYSIHEPGNVTAILHENYVDSKTCDHAQVVETLSDSMLFESKVYEGNWELYNYYNVMGCILPAHQIGHTLKLPLRPGSMWTKYQSMCARSKRLDALAHRRPDRKLTMDHIFLLFKYAESGNVDVLREHGVTAQDLDVLNHVSPYRKIRPKDLANLKKRLNEMNA
jgi:hypothetical protein